MPTPATPLEDAVEGDEGGLGGTSPPGSSWAGEWINLLPLATQRRVESILTPLAKIAIFCHPPPNFAPPSSPFNSILERVVNASVLSYQRIGRQTRSFSSLKKAT